jgi:hypothetical protein
MQNARILPCICAVISFGFMARTGAEIADENKPNGGQLSTVR